MGCYEFTLVTASGLLCRMRVVGGGVEGEGRGLKEAVWFSASRLRQGQWSGKILVIDAAVVNECN